MPSSNSRVWLSPLTAIMFVAIGLTGVLMFFHVRSGAINVLHELAGLLFVIVGVLHLIVNWKTFCCYLKRRTAWITLGVGLAICVALLALGAGHEGRHGHAGAPPQAPITR
jgi:hypothetical protein